MACVYTFCISSGRLSMESVVAAMKYHVFLGRYGCRRMEDMREGVMIEGHEFIMVGCCPGVAVLDSFSSTK